MSKNSEKTCAFCGKKEYGVETIDQIPSDQICPQDFILNELLSYCEGKLKPDDFICTSHENSIRLKYLSYKNGLSFSNQFSRKKITHCECSTCKRYCNTERNKVIDISQLSNDFKEFILNEYTHDHKKMTCSGSGIGEGG